VTPLSDILKPVAVTALLSVGAWGFSVYRDLPSTKVEIHQIRDALQNEEALRREHETSHDADRKALYQLEGKVDGISAQIDALRQELRLSNGVRSRLLHSVQDTQER
jgi:hypothetical protein